VVQQVHFAEHRWKIRAAQRLHDKPIVLDAVKAKLSWQTSDFFQHLVCQGTAEELAEFVSKPTSSSAPEEDRVCRHGPNSRLAQGPWRGVPRVPRERVGRDSHAQAPEQGVQGGLH
jgi:hypothetical protein